MKPRLSMLDLFSGTASASRAAAVRGWRVLRVDNDPQAAADVRADLRTWTPPGFFDLVWASPPCDRFSTAQPQRTRDTDEGLELVRAALAIIEQVDPRWWVLENVHGATRAIGSLIGPPVAQHGSFYLWGVFPPFIADVPRDKTRKSGRQRARRRGAIPWAISEGLVRACEALDRELWDGPEVAPRYLPAGAGPAPLEPPPAPGPAPLEPPPRPGPAPLEPPTSPGRSPGQPRRSPGLQLALPPRVVGGLVKGGGQ